MDRNPSVDIVQPSQHPIAPPKNDTGSWLRDAGAVAFLVLVLLVFFWPVILNRAWIPRGGGDLVSFIYPMYRFTARSLWSGAIPLWNPYLYAGAPFVADNQSGVFYPINLALFFINPEFSFRAIEGLVIWHFLISGVGMYFCLRWWRRSVPIHRLAALAGAVCFMLSGVFITHIGNLNLNAVISWLPLTFGMLHRAYLSTSSSSRLVWAANGGLILGVSTLAGHGQSTFLAASFLASYALYHTVVNRGKWGLPLLALLGSVAVGAAAISLFPALEFTPYTVRGGFSFEQSTHYSLPPAALVGLLAPDFFGRGASGFWQDWPRVEYGYAGVLPWFLAVIALIRRPIKRQAFFVLAGLLFLLLALGSNTPLYSLIFGHRPIVPFRAPARFVLLLDFSLAMLAGIGLDSLVRRDWTIESARWLLGGLALLVFLPIGVMLAQADLLSATYPHREDQMTTAVMLFGVFGLGSWLLVVARVTSRLSHLAVLLLALVWLSTDLVALGHHVEIEWDDPTLGFADDSPAMNYLKADPGLHRIDIATGKWQPSLPQIEGFFAIGGVYNPLELANYAVYTGSMGPRGSALYNLLGAKYVIGGKSEPPADTNIIVPVYDEDPSVTVFLNTLALPRAMVLYNAVVVPDHEAAFDAIHRPDFDPVETIVLEGGRALSQSPGQSKIQVTQYALNEASFEVTNDKPAYFLLTDMHHPHWRASVDGEPARILVADYAFRALFLEAGTHQVSFQFAPRVWYLGVIVTVLTWSVVVGCTARYWRRKG